MTEAKLYESLPAKIEQLDLGKGTTVHHLPDWNKYDDPKKLEVLRKIAEMRGRDPRIAKLAVSIIKKAKVKPRDYKGQATALLKWVQSPKNVYYVNEPGERLQDPIFTIKNGFGDCFAEDTLVLRDDMALVKIQNVQIGDRIWGRDQWTTVVNFWDKGVLPVTEIALDNGSVLRLTEEHKVYVWRCTKHGGDCKRIHMKNSICSLQHGAWQRIAVAELTEHDIMLQPARIQRSDADATKLENSNADMSWLMGAYVAEGWKEAQRVMISGLDGTEKQKTKERARDIAQNNNWSIRWDKRYIALNSHAAVDFVAEVPSGAVKKQIPAHFLRQCDLAELDKGLKLDATKNTRGEGWTFSTISPALAVQYRVIQRLQGRSTHVSLVTDHGGFGTNPIYRIGVRNPKNNDDKRLFVKKIKRNADSVPCYDIATEDHYVYLPEADCTVSNCDDQNILLCSLFESVKLPWKYVISGRSRVNGTKMRYIEGDPYPLDGDWTHIYCMVGTPPFQPTEWYFCECTVEGVPLGWDVISGDHSFLPEMAKTKKGPQRIMDIGIKAPKGFKPIPLPKNKQWSPAIYQALDKTADEAAYSGTFQFVRNSGIGSSVGSSIATEMLDSEEKSSTISLFDFKKIAQAVSTGVLISVATQLVLDYVRSTDTWAKLSRKK